MIGDGFKLLVIGMGYVVTFLSIMVLIMLLAAKVLKPFAHLLEEKAAAPRRAPASGGNDDRSLIAAAIAAVHMHRNRK